jgi:hypothetical protein
MLAQAGLPKIRFHDLQTTCSLLLAAGLPLPEATTIDTLVATPQFCGTTSTLQIRKKKHRNMLDNKTCQC